MRMNVERVEPSLGVLLSTGFLVEDPLSPRDSPGFPCLSVSLADRCPARPFLLPVLSATLARVSSFRPIVITAYAHKLSSCVPVASILRSSGHGHPLGLLRLRAGIPLLHVHTNVSANEHARHVRRRCTRTRSSTLGGMLRFFRSTRSQS
jgi:hypothetical protein